ncbi:MAG TPA: phosphoglucosamine mutase [Gemmatales bacterium]|nr:phosphoglucosamine mutase [Gemmatales bacterium]
MSQLIVSVSGIRGIVGETLTPAVVLQFAEALGSYLGQGSRVALSRDNRPSGTMLGAAAAAGLLSVGSEVVDLGIATTPSVGVFVRENKLAGGIQISASHNPAPWNGLKLFGSDGAVLAPAEGKQVVNLFQSQAFRRLQPVTSRSWHPVASENDPHSPLQLHARLAATQANTEAVRRKGFRVFVDANGGAGGPLAVHLLQQCLSCMVEGIGLHPSDSFAHIPEPTAENLAEIAPMVASKRCAVGFALDPDADRLALMDDLGRYIGEELTLALCLEYVLRKSRGTIVVNMSTSRINEDLARQYGCSIYRSAVGEANVVAMMRQHQAVLGGEGNGGVIDPRVGWVRDPFVAMGLVLSLMAEENRPLSTLVDALPQYVIQKDKYEVDPLKLPALYESLIEKYPDARVNRLDGLRLDWPDRWVHIRPSNTEPIVRVIAEAPRADQAAELCQLVGASLK